MQQTARMILPRSDAKRVNAKCNSQLAASYRIVFRHCNP
jgi:hypothetical protein